MDNIFTLIVIVITVLSVIGRIKKNAKQGTQPPNAGGWVTKLNAFLADIQSKMEQQTSEGHRGASDWRRLMEAGNAASSEDNMQEETLDDLEFEDARAQPRQKRKPAVKHVGSKTTRPLKKSQPAVAPPLPASHDSRLVRPTMTASRADLRKAIIWSEILGPPVALRDQRSGQR